MSRQVGILLKYIACHKKHNSRSGFFSFFFICHLGSFRIRFQIHSRSSSPEKSLEYANASQLLANLNGPLRLPDLRDRLLVTPKNAGGNERRLALFVRLFPLPSSTEGVEMHICSLAITSFHLVVYLSAYHSAECSIRQKCSIKV